MPPCIQIIKTTLSPAAAKKISELGSYYQTPSSWYTVQHQTKCEGKLILNDHFSLQTDSVLPLVITLNSLQTSGTLLDKPYHHLQKKMNCLRHTASALIDWPQWWGQSRLHTKSAGTECRSKVLPIPFSPQNNHAQTLPAMLKTVL